MKGLTAILAVALLCGTAQAKTHTVEYGDSLWKIAVRYYKDGEQWRRIYRANKAKIRRPGHIRPGQRLTIPLSARQKPLLARDDIPAGYRYWKTERMVVRAYDPMRCCCQGAANGKTSTGKNAWIMDGVAVAKTMIPYGTMMWIPGAGWKIADDTGPSPRRGAKKGQYRIEIRMRTHKEGEKWGKQTKTVDLYRKEK